VRFTQIEECIQKALFAIDTLPRTPPLQRGELLLLQLVKQDATKLDKEDSRIEFALVFDHSDPDPDGSISRLHWPRAGKTWRHILVCTETIPLLPISLENLPLKGDYAGQTQCVQIDPSDEGIIRAHALQWNPVAAGEPMYRRILLTAIRNYDQVIRLSPKRVAHISEHDRRISDPWPGDALKTLYRHQCQVCKHSFEPRYGIPHAQTRFITPLATGGSLNSRNRLVVCPNHDAIISVTKPRYDPANFRFDYPNGLVERLVLTDHLTK
jgi:hypothetical protein